MKKILFNIVLLVTNYGVSWAPSLDPDTQFLDQTVIMGSIQFPTAITEVPHVRIYYAGNKIRSEIDHYLRRAIFSLPTNRTCKTFYLVICEHIQPHTQEENLVRYLKIKPNTPYKMYRLDLIQVPSKDPKRPHAYEREWQIREVRVATDGRIPDYAIIVCYNPDFIGELEVSSHLELPVIKIRPDILTIVGSQEAFQLVSLQALLSSLENDLIHAWATSDVKQNYQKTIIAMIT